MGESPVALVHYGATFGAVLEAALQESGLSFQALNAGHADTPRQLERTRPSVVVLDGSSRGVSKALTVHQLFRLCPGTVVIQVWPDDRPVEVHRGPWAHAPVQGDLVELTREIVFSQGEVGL